MKKILFVSSIQIFPPMSGGQLRSANLCRALVRLGYDVQVYSLTGRKENYLSRKPSFNHTLESGIRESVNMNPVWGLVQFLFYRLQLPPLWVTWLLSVFIPADLKKALSAADQVMLDFPFLASLQRDSKKPLWLNTHNAEFELWKNPLVSNAVKSIELKALSSAQQVLFCSEDDRQKFVGIVPGLYEKSSVVSNGVDVSQFLWSEQLREGTRQKLGIQGKKVFLFTGSSYQPNQEAFQFLQSFAQQNKAVLVQMGVVILVVGTVSQNLQNEEHFKILGRVDDIIPYFAASDFGLNPVVQGSGVNVKMIEFMAARLPILSTAFGCRGLSLEDRRNCFVFSRDQLMSVLETVLAVSDEELKTVSTLALGENENKVDMTKALLGTGL
ncbi:glycosyltransferase family 4 protein [Bdellovibrio sp. HCB274]|uniref:glycosyltransferase family 4 protein n=1 Tax=Bdellovibrio sp. HCB274 TaxID=3394361 RepID=UPI0039B597F6